MVYQVQLFLDNQYGVSQSECKIDRPRPGLSRLAPRPHTKALGTMLNEIHSNQMDKINCLQKEAGAKKIVCNDNTTKKIMVRPLKLHNSKLSKQNGILLNVETMSMVKNR
jgi:hypothetical protein